MRRLLPAFVQRRMLLAAARRALEAGRPEAALGILGDALLLQDPRAASLRTMILPLVPAPPPPPRLEPSAAATASESRNDLRELLAQMRAVHGKPAAEDAGSPPAAGPAQSVASAADARPARLRMSLDDAGSFLICAGTTATIGHARAGEADIPILADLLPRHARLVLVPPSFQGSAGWRVEPIGSAPAWIGDESIGPAGKLLVRGERLRLAERTLLLFDEPDRASISAALDLEGALEAAGAKRVLLFAPGNEGRLSIGAQGWCHVRAALGGVELELVHDGSRLWIRCASGMIPDEAQGSPALTEIELSLRLSQAQHLRLCMPKPSERPRWISFAPMEDS